MKNPFSGACCCEAGCGEPVLFPNETEEVIEAAEESDVRIPVPTPQLPSQSDIDDHCITHIPYRSWCRCCVEGRGREMAHKEVDHGSRDVATVAFDYLFVTKKDVFTKGEWASEATRAEVEENALKVLVVRDLKSRSCFAHAVPQKGID